MLYFSGISKKSFQFFVVCLFFVGNVQAANWLMLQGTEPSSAAGRAKLWGFIQPIYQSTKGTLVQAGPWAGAKAQFNQLAPNFTSHSGFNIQRARIGVRGQGFPLNPNINYFILAEFGNNGITSFGGGDGSVKIDHASITLNYIKGMRIRAGLFKTPGVEEGLQAIHVFDYINFTNVSAQLLLERFFDHDGSNTAVIPRPTPPPIVRNSGDENSSNGPVGAFRDIGIQLFDTFTSDEWETSYALMIGNGNGINRTDNNNSLDKYFYLAREKVYGGKGPRRQGLKMFAWWQQGERDLINEFTGEKKSYERIRQGIGMAYRKAKIRATIEYIEAEGMIFNGTDGGALVGSVSSGPPPIVAGVTASFNIEPEEKADGYYIDLGYLYTPQIELDVRYDVLNRATNTKSKERSFVTITFGIQYFFDKKNRLTLNYELRSAEAPNLPQSHNANKILEGMDNRISVQLTSIF